MNLRNNNREIIRSLAKKSYCYSRGRNRVLICAVALAVIIVFCVLSIASGRLEADRLRDIRSSGLAPSYSFQNPTDRQYRKAKALPYVRYAGEEWNFGTAYEGKYLLTSCTAVSAETFQLIYSPAFTDIAGRYPRTSNEIMLPLCALEEMGIGEPKIGQKIHLNISFDNKDREETFVLSGYFTDYKDGRESISNGFFSKSYLKKIGLGSISPDTLRIQPQKLLDGAENTDQEIERLRRDVGISEEQSPEAYFVGFLAYSERAGGYGTALLFLLALLLCTALLINNVTYISLNRDTRHYGHLITLGATQRQIEKIILRQVLRIIVIGLLIGTAVSCLIVLCLIPSLLRHLYLTDYGPETELMGFHPLWLAATVLLVFLTTLVSAMAPARKVSRYSPVDARGYVEPVKRTPDSRSSKNGGKLYRQAWRYAFLNKRKAAAAILSVVLAIVVTLTAVMITDGYDSAKEIETEPDFQIYTGYEIGFGEPIQLDKETKAKILNIEGIKLKECTYGDFFSLDKGDAVWKPVLSDADLMAGAVMVDDAYIEKLASYAKKHDLQIDIKGLKAGESAVEIYANRLSGAELKKADEKIGTSFMIEDNRQSVLGTLKFAGYLDQSKKGFPETGLIMHTSDTPILLMTEKAFLSAGLKPKIQDLSLTVEPDRKHAAKKELEEILQQRNKELRTNLDRTDPLSLTAKSDSIDYNTEIMRAQRIMTYSITVLLMLMGIMNYFNIIITGIFSRKRELSMLECVGMTRKQLRRMLVLEGCYYSLIIAVISFALGSAVLFAADKYMKTKIYVFQFYYPWAELLTLVTALFLFSILVPLLVYRKTEAEPMAERMKCRV